MTMAERITIAEHMVASARSGLRTWLYIARTTPGARQIAIRAAQEHRGYLLDWQKEARRLRAGETGDAA